MTGFLLEFFSGGGEAKPNVMLIFLLFSTTILGRKSFSGGGGKKHQRASPVPCRPKPACIHYVKYKRGCAVQVKIYSTSEDIQYK